MSALLYQKGKQMRKAIVYASVHHGNTEKLVKKIAEECQVDLIDAVKQPDTDLRDRKSTRLNSSHASKSRMPSSA